MKKVFSIIVFLSLLIYTSCIDVVEEILLNKDGSGRYSCTMDMSAIFSKENRTMLEAISQGGDSEIPDLSTLDMEMDSTIVMSDLMKSEGIKLEDPELWDRVFVSTQMSSSEEKYMVTLMIDFEDIEELNYVFEQLSMQENAVATEESPIPLSMFTNNTRFQLKGKTLTKTDANQAENIDEESMAMMIMFLSNASYKMQYTMPKKIKKTDFENANVEGKTMHVEYPLLDIMNGEVNTSGLIKF